VGHIPPGSHRFLATVLAAYIQFGATVYFILKEFKWFTKNRHEYLSATRPDNYTIYINHIPPEYCSSDKLIDYCRDSFSHNAVLEAHIALDDPILEKTMRSKDEGGRQAGTCRGHGEAQGASSNASKYHDREYETGQFN
jgi:hypothetical protein